MVNYYELNIFAQIYYITVCVQAGVAFFGIIGNILQICVFSRKSLRKYSYSFYCQMKAICDTFLLLNSFKSMSAFVLDSNLDTVSIFFCFWNNYVPYIMSEAALWLVPAISLDRLLMIVYPNRFEWTRKRWVQFLVFSAILIYSSLVTIIHPLNLRFGRVVFNGVTIVFCQTPLTIGTTHYWILTSNIFVMVLVVNNFLNICLIRHILASRKRVTLQGSNSTRRMASKDRKFAITSICLSLMAAICKMPIGIGFLITYQIGTSTLIVIMIHTINLAIMNLENAAGFYVNIFTNSIFKEEFLAMIGIKRSGPSSSVISHSNNAFQNTQIISTKV